MTRSSLPADLDPATLTAIVDSREQMPWDLSPLQMQAGTLTSGDYSLAGLQHVVSVERKSLEDLLGCIGAQRERFQREVDRLAGIPHRLLIVESSWGEIELGQWCSKIRPASVIGSLLGWQAQGLPRPPVQPYVPTGCFRWDFLFRHFVLRNLQWIFYMKNNPTTARPGRRINPLWSCPTAAAYPSRSSVSTRSILSS